MDTLGYLSGLDAPVRDRLLPWAGRIPAALLSRCSLARLDKGDELVHELDRFSYIYVLTRGTIASTSPLVDGGTYVIDEFRAPVVFGEMEAIGASPFYHSSLTATTPAELLRTSSSDYLAWLTGDAEALLARSRWVVQRLASQSSHERSLLTWTAEKRVAHVFCQLYEEGGRERLVVPLTRARLAERIGVSTKTVSRSVASLAGAGMARLEGRKIVIDREAFALLEKMLRNELGQGVHTSEGRPRS
ncbi:Crp/Fnr family transcriptional regulator [Olsenella sp. Marseille-P4559]|uniref:Crp/Fnr family transcriptional regulator n=1 Tax=Olsenella sp. Marseille-P4559 TaxID=2364795 RepID=UPI0013EF54A6|nr:Crp/Fnr family transcriptional regulator [Olsenella sp. Marseille-P4559]